MKKPWKIIITFCLIILAVTTASLFLLKYKNYIGSNSEFNSCRTKAQKYASDWEKRSTSSDDELSVTTVPGSYSVHYTSKTRLCAAQISSATYSDAGVSYYDALVDVNSGQVLTERKQSLSKTGQKNDSNPNFLEQLNLY